MWWWIENWRHVPSTTHQTTITSYGSDKAEVGYSTFSYFWLLALVSSSFFSLARVLNATAYKIDYIMKFVVFNRTSLSPSIFLSLSLFCSLWRKMNEDRTKAVANLLSSSIVKAFSIILRYYSFSLLRIYTILAVNSRKSINLHTQWAN